MPPTMYQVCTKHVSNNHQLWLIKMYQHHQLYTSCMCELINYLSQPCTQHVPQPKSLINPYLICKYVIDLLYMIAYLQTFLNFNNKRIAFSSNFTLVSHWSKNEEDLYSWKYLQVKFYVLKMQMDYLCNTTFNRILLRTKHQYSIEKPQEKYSTPWKRDNFR